MINSIKGFPVDTLLSLLVKHPSIQIYYDLMSDAIKAGLDRDSLIITLGGGMA